MASSSWPSPTSTAASPSAAFALRPLSLGEILDRIFAIYRRHFWLYASLSAVSGVVQLVLSSTNLLIGHHYRAHHTLSQFTVLNGGLSVIAGILFILASAVTQAATIYAIAELYLGRPATIGESLRLAMRKPFRYVGIMLWTVWSSLWLGLVLFLPAILLTTVLHLASLQIIAGLLLFVAVLGGGIYGAIAYIRNSLAVAASVVETLPIRPSMRRSKVLAAGAKGRIFVVFLIYFALAVVIAAAQTPLLALIARNPTGEHAGVQAIILVVSFLTHTLLTPVLMIGLALIYFDQRVRKEAFDIAFLLGAEAPLAAAPSAASPFGLAPEAPAAPATAPPTSIAAEPYPYNLQPETSPFNLSAETTPIYPPPVPAPEPPTAPAAPADDEPQP